MRRGTILALFFALGAAAIFARLGVWQLHRLSERRAFNAELSSRIGGAPLAVADLPADTALAAYRRVHAEGTFDYARQIVITGRSRQGAPGVFLVTPLRPADGGAAVLVNRGWVYSPDASAVNASLWVEPSPARVDGYVSPLPEDVPRDPVAVNNPRAVRELDRARIRELVPYAVQPFLVIDLSPGRREDGVPTRLTVPVLDEGPHKDYAIQWFTFAAIALYGAAYLLWLEWKERSERRAEPRPEPV